MQVEHKTEKGTVLFVKVPDGAYNFSNNMQPNQLDYYTDIPFNGSKLTFSECIILPKVDWQLIGLTSEVTEGQAKMIVDYNYFFSKVFQKSVKNYRDYLSDDYTIISALDSFKSLMQHLQMYEVNPYEKPNINEFKTFPFCPTGECKAYFDSLKEWQEAEHRSGNWIVLFKEN